MNGVAVILLIISLVGILALFCLIKKFKRNIINKGDLKSHIAESANRLRLRHPVLLIEEQSQKISGHAFLFLVSITSTALEKLDKEEQFAVIDHELGHIKNLKEDLLFYLYLVFPFPFIGYSIILPIVVSKVWLYTIPFFIMFLILRCFKLDYVIHLKRNSEFEADRISAELGNTKALISTLKKIEKNIRTQNKFYWIYFSNRPFYPSIDERIKKLEEFIKSN